MGETGRNYGFNFITFEGPDKAGKSSQYELTIDFLRSVGLDIVSLREPGGEDFSEKIRNIVLDPENNIHDVTELLLYEAARANMVRNVVAPSLRKGKTIVCDRYADSSLAYQGYGRELGVDIVRIMNDFATDGIYPGLTLLYLGQVAEKDSTRLEQQGSDFDERVRDGYLELARAEPERIKVVRPISGSSIEESIKRTFEEGTLPPILKFLNIS